MCSLIDLTRAMRRCLNLMHVHKFSSNSFHFIPKINDGKTYFTLNIIENKLHTSVRFLKSSEDNITKDKPTTEDAAKTDKKKKQQATYITLIAPNKHITVTTLEDATKLAIRRDLKLIKIKDNRTQVRKDRPTYQLLTAAQYLQEEKKHDLSGTDKNKSVTKGVKLLSMSSKINEHDINAKIKNIIRWLQKQNEVRVAISKDNEEAENVYNKIYEGSKEMGKLVQKREKGNEIRFQILPLQEDKSTSSTSSS